MLGKRHVRLAFAGLVAVTALLSLALCGQAPRAGQGAEPGWGIAIHGGAGALARGSLTPAQEAAYRAGLEEALRAGHAVLERGGTSLEAVEAAVNRMEDSRLFNAGAGAVRTRAGAVELDASIMDGRTRSAGAVAGVGRVRNPIDLARLVMTESPHVLLIGPGAEAFAVERGMELVDSGYFARERPRAAAPPERKLGTVGAVALDRSGHLAAGTSTGGIANKLPGRVGDSPIIGAGTYADDRCGAISATGQGEYFIRAVVAHEICALALHEGIPLRDAADQVVMEELVRMGGDGGVVAMDPRGVPSFSFNTGGMFRGYLGREGRPFVEIYRD
jgi:beta-aspartyl-peptidase (threonine type)